MKCAVALSSLLSCLVPSLVLAQSTQPPPKLEQRFETAYVGVTGNASSNTFSLGADLIARPDSWLIRDRFTFVRN
jgi:hypothetical protein